MCRPVRGRRSSSERLSWMLSLPTGLPGCVARKMSNFAEACVEIVFGCTGRLMQFLNQIGKFYSRMNILFSLLLDFDSLDLEYHAFIDYMTRFEQVVTPIFVSLMIWVHLTEVLILFHYF